MSRESRYSWHKETSPCSLGVYIKHIREHVGPDKAKRIMLFYTVDISPDCMTYPIEYIIREMRLIRSLTNKTTRFNFGPWDLLQVKCEPSSVFRLIFSKAWLHELRMPTEIQQPYYLFDLPEITIRKVIQTWQTETLPSTVDGKRKFANRLAFVATRSGLRLPLYTQQPNTVVSEGE
jgi:hypothetical protein